MKGPAHSQVWATLKATQIHTHFHAAARITEVLKSKEGKREREQPYRHLFSLASHY